MARIKLRKTGLRVRKSYEDDDIDFQPISLHHIVVVEEAEREDEFTGLLDASGNPIFKTFMKKNPIGFMADWSENGDFDPDCFYYNTKSHYAAVSGEEEDDTDG